MYKTPQEHFFRLNFPRSRFSRTLEDTLLVLADRIVNIGIMEKDQFGKLLDKAIRETSEGDLEEMTIRNQRTEMIRLFGLVKYEGDLAIPGSRLSMLIQTQDTPRFFKSFCNRFQFPGGFLKAYKVSEMVQAGVRFKPASYVLRMLKIATSKYGEFALNAAEVTHFIFYDRRITVDGEEPKFALARIVEARENNVELDKTNDLIRYARDFLNYMVEANLLTKYKGMYALNEKEATAIKTIIADKNFFDQYSKAIRQDGTWDSEEYKKADEEWTEWFADSVEDDAFETSTQALMPDDTNYPTQWQKLKEILERKDPTLRGAALKEIGDEGEKIAYEYEKDSIRKINPSFVRMVKLVSDTQALGYDLLSVSKEDVRKKKYIEVKTTKKNRTTGLNIPFTISINEWSVAKQLGDDYYVYRVIISKEGVTIFSIQNPCQRANDKTLTVEPTGFKVTYSDEAGSFLEM